MSRANGDPSRRYEFGNGAAEVLRDEETTRIVLAGDLDMSTVAQVQPIVESACASSPEKVIVDLSAVEFVDWHGLHLLAATHLALTTDGCVFLVIPPAEHVRRAFEITGLDQLFGAGRVDEWPRRSGSGITTTSARDVERSSPRGAAVPTPGGPTRTVGM